AQAPAIRRLDGVVLEADRLAVERRRRDGDRGRAARGRLDLLQRQREALDRALARRAAACVLERDRAATDLERAERRARRPPFGAQRQRGGLDRQPFDRRAERLRPAAVLEAQLPVADRERGDVELERGA